ncbi:MAG: hypothetical protein ACKO37_07265 [Vampirovibrionales bacterium]
MMFSACETPVSQEANTCCLSEKLLHIAEEAWHELMKEKIKVAMEASCGDAMTHLAQAAAQASKAQWEAKLSAKMATKQASHHLKDVICKTFSRSCENPSSGHCGG